MSAKIEAEDPTQLFEEIWPRLKEDLDAIKQENLIQGYKVLVLQPLRVSLNQLGGKMGFLVVLSREKAKELLNAIRIGLHYTVNIEFGLHKRLAVFVIILKFAETRQVIIYPVYYHTNLEWLIKDQGKRGLYTFFSVEGGQIIGEIYLGSYKAYLYSQYVR